MIEKDDIIVHLKRELDMLREKYSDYDRVVERGDRLEAEKAEVEQECIKLR